MSAFFLLLATGSGSVFILDNLTVVVEELENFEVGL